MTKDEALERMAENARELGLDYEPDDGALTKDQIDQIRGEPVAWTRTDVDSPIIHEEMMQRHPELRQYYPVPLYMAPSNKE